MVVHGQQRFEYSRQIVWLKDVLTADVTISDIRDAYRRTSC